MDLDSNDPRSFGWQYPAVDVVPFTYQGHAFPSGVDRRVVGLFTSLLDQLTAVPGFALHTGAGYGDGDWGYENRTIGGSSSLSFHAFALALDVNAPWNPRGVNGYTGGPFGIPDAADRIALTHGCLWGGNSRWPTKDRMHFEVHLSPSEISQTPRKPTGGHPFPLPAGWCFGPNGAPHNVSGFGNVGADQFAQIKMIQAKVGVTADGYFGPKTSANVAYFQRSHGLFPDGLVGPLTWRELFPA
jgi:peptidoglycan hydrolase-like protein with peptidoglycan-binding domain